MSNNSPINAPAILREAGNTLNQRGVDYDGKGGERSMAHAVQIFNTIVKREGAMSEQDGWIFMLALKQARMMQGKPKMDTYVDLAGYAGLLGECALATRIQAASTAAVPTPTDVPV